MYRDNADYIGGVYQTPPPDVTGRNVFLVDFSYKRPIVEQMIKVAKSVTLIDHHVTAIDDLKGLDNLKTFTDVEHSGAMLAWKYLRPDETPPPLLKHIEDRDLWYFKLPNTREIQAFVFSHDYTFETWDELMKADENELARMAIAGAAIERKHHKDINELINVCKRRMMIAGFDVPVASLPYTFVSDAAHNMAINEPFAACYWDTPTFRIFGLRSVDQGIDVSEIAKQYGGGGHKHAAGFSVPREHELARN